MADGARMRGRRGEGAPSGEPPSRRAPTANWTRVVLSNDEITRWTEVSVFLGFVPGFCCIGPINYI